MTEEIKDELKLDISNVLNDTGAYKKLTAMLEPMGVDMDDLAYELEQAIVDTIEEHLQTKLDEL